MEFNDLLRLGGLDPRNVAVALHKMSTRTARRNLCLMVEEDPEAFNAYQSTHPAIQEATLKARTMMASFVMADIGEFTLVGIYSNRGSQPFPFGDAATRALFVRMMDNVDGLNEWGQSSQSERLADLKDRLLFDLSRTGDLADLAGRLIVRDPGARNYMRVAERTSLPVVEIKREARIVPPIPDWDELVLGAEELRNLPREWRVQLAAWRGVYLIVDRTDGARYVGAAYGAENLLGRWSQHVAGEKGITRELSRRHAAAFQFSILELVSPAADADCVIHIERKWMNRLGTIEHGLNA